MSKFTGMSVLDLTRQVKGCENSNYGWENHNSFLQQSSFTNYYSDSSPKNESKKEDWILKKGGNNQNVRNNFINPEEEKKYRELRDRNNLAAKISRSKKKQKEYAEKQKIVSLREENMIMKKALSCCTCHQLISKNQWCNFCPSTNLV